MHMGWKVEQRDSSLTSAIRECLK